jgi:hypothetical protein
VLALSGATPSPPPAPVPPADLPLDGPALGVLAGVLAAMLLAFALGRFLALRPDASLGNPVEPGAGVILALALSVATLLLWLTNPYAGLLAVPAAHLWMLAVLTRPAPRRRARLLMLAAGLVLPLMVVAYYLIDLSLNPLEGAWFLLMLVTGHSVGLATVLSGCLLLAVVGGLTEMVVRLPDEPEEEPVEPGPSLFGPGTHAGRGALGGTQSTFSGS